MSGHDGLTPADELELRRRREAEERAAQNATMNKLLRAAYRRAKAEAGGLAEQGDLRPSLAEIEAKQAELAAAGMPHGLRPLAKALHSSPATIRRRLGRLK